MTGRLPSVTVAVPVLNEEADIADCLEAIVGQSYFDVIEILVVDGGSADATRQIAARYPGVRVLDNPRRIQAAALNIALAEARGDVFVRVDGHCRIAPDYIERCVEALAVSRASVVGGAMTPTATGPCQRGIAVAMRSRLGAGPARFHTGGAPGWVDTVYLGAFDVVELREAGGYAEDVGVNEDSELAHRLSRRGGVWFDPSIVSSYTPRSTLGGLARQFFRYGLSRAATVRRHPLSLAPRQLAAPLLVLGLVSPWRRRVATAYLALIAGRAAIEAAEDPAAGAVLSLAMPMMHVAWAAGFIAGIVGIGAPRRPALHRRSTDEGFRSA
jgi:glycosyltransferase involved in cell wall biosynthesis